MSLTESASAAPHVVPLHGDLVADGAWHSFSVTRTTTQFGNITFTPDSFPGAQLSIRLRNMIDPHQPVFSDEVTWNAGDHSTKTLATDVVGGTQYAVDAKLSLQTFTGRLVTS